MTKQEPKTFIEAARDPRWMEAMDEELRALILQPFNTTSLRHKLEGGGTETAAERPKKVGDGRKPTRMSNTLHLSLRGRVEILSSTKFSPLVNHVT